MIDGKISVDCPDCGGELECKFDSHADPWNESELYEAVCFDCGCTMKFSVHADEPISAEEE